MEDEFDTLKRAHTPPDLQSWNIEDLEAYKNRLTDEINRIDEVIKTKKDVTSKADALFKS